MIAFCFFYYSKTIPKNQCNSNQVGTGLLCFYVYPLCYAAVLLKFTCYAQYYAQALESLSDYCAIYIQVCMNSSLHVADICYVNCFIRVYL